MQKAIFQTPFLLRIGHIGTPPCAYLYVPMCFPYATLRKIHFIMSSKCPSTWLTITYYVALTNSESNAQKEKKHCIKATQMQGK